MLGDRAVKMTTDAFHHPVQLATDAGTLILSGGWLSASLLDKIHGLEGAISGGLIVALLTIRVVAAYRGAIRGELRNDRD
jgi:hypothetical protein